MITRFGRSLKKGEVRNEKHGTGTYFYFLALNLVHDIVTGKRSAKDARKFYAEAVLQMKHPEYMQGFVFPASSAEQGDTDQAVMAGGGGRNEKP